MSKRKKRKKPLGEYKWVQDAIQSIIETPESEQEEATLEFMAKKVREKEDGSGQD